MAQNDNLQTNYPQITSEKYKINFTETEKFHFTKRLNSMY